MRTWMTWTAAVGFALLIGCGGGGDAGTHPGAAGGSRHRLGPHQGPAFELPGGGFAEVTTETVKGATDPVVAVYFLQADGKSPLSIAPADARVVIDGKEYPLTAKSSVGAKADPARLASAPVPIDPDRVTGELKATINGAAFETAFLIGQ